MERQGGADAWRATVRGWRDGGWEKEGMGDVKGGAREAKEVSEVGASSMSADWGLWYIRERY